MSIRAIHVIPDALLRQKAEPVTIFDDELRTLIDDMLETMYAAPGIGLAAPQIGIMKRLAVVDVSSREDGEAEAPIALINPEIVWSSEEMSVYQEGCLSIPDVYEEVVRPERIRVRFLDRDGEEQEIEADGVLATCIQHEMDHLDGVLFIDHISKLKRDMVWKRFVKTAKREGGPKPYTPKPGPKVEPEKPAEELGEL
ncbi:peptide deformylase [Terrihabitans sp. B22-R8]|uniref:peptide deformylase n=1 Tax=Terrihabitans sp. B22-R8 TaxID=3425128 RepID=UPI00403C9074